MHQSVDNPRVLVFSRTTAFRHRSIPAGVQAIRELGAEHGFTVEATEDTETLTAEAARQTAIVFLSTSGTVLDAAGRAALENAIRAGVGFVGVHAATTAERDWPFYRELLGARFVDHPAIQPAGMTVEDATHPATAHLDTTWDLVDEWYNFDGNPRGEVRVLLSVDESGYDAGPNAMGEDHPISWCHERFGGRSWYTALGHDGETYSDPSFRAHLLGGIRWAAHLTT